MSEISLILVLQIQTSKFFNDMAKVSIKSEKMTTFGGIFFVLDKFDSILSSVIDSHLGLRSMLIGYRSGVLRSTTHGTDSKKVPSKEREGALTEWEAIKKNSISAPKMTRKVLKSPVLCHFCHHNATRNRLIVSDCCKDGIVATKINFLGRKSRGLHQTTP